MVIKRDGVMQGRIIGIRVDKGKGTAKIIDEKEKKR